MLVGFSPLRCLALVVSMAAAGCHAQLAATPVEAGVKLSPEMARRVEVLIRSRSDIPADYTITVGDPTKTDFTGFTEISVFFAQDGKPPKSVPFLLSTDGKTLAQLTKFDISQDPKDKVSAAGRPGRGGPPNAPVVIVGFDDLECPYCAIMNAELFPAVQNRYKDQVRIVYRDLPLDDLHPWARHAAVDANCLAEVSLEGYWNFVDYVHAHAADMAGTEKTAVKANQNLDKIALDEGVKQKVKQADLVACVLKQDDHKITASVMQAEADPIRAGSTPLLYVNGEKIEGVVPIETLYRVIDRALIAAGQTPPPPPPAPPAKATPPAAPAAATPSAAAPATKPGS